jgi:hypothetical protein
MTTQVQMVPESQFHDKDLERLLSELRGVVQRDVMRIEQAAAYLAVSITTLHLMCRKGLPYHRVDGLGGKIFLRSELIDYIKKS